jgi:hypothetical protein
VKLHDILTGPRAIATRTRRNGDRVRVTFKSLGQEEPRMSVSTSYDGIEWAGSPLVWEDYDAGDWTQWVPSPAPIRRAA